MTGGSVQLRAFRRALRDGSSVEDAAAQSGIGLGEARLTVAEDAKNPPPPEAYELLGHNLPPKENAMAEMAADDRLRLLIERYERLDEERKGISDDMKDVLNEAKATGYDVKGIRAVIRIRKMKPHDRKEMEAILSLYCGALGIETQGTLF